MKRVSRERSLGEFPKLEESGCRDTKARTLDTGAPAAWSLRETDVENGIRISPLLPRKKSDTVESPHAPRASDVFLARPRRFLLPSLLLLQEGQLRRTTGDTICDRARSPNRRQGLVVRSNWAFSFPDRPGKKKKEMCGER